MKTTAGFMVCDVNSAPCSELYATYEAAKAAAREYPIGGYHARPVRVTVEVLGSPPEPWCFRVVAGREVPL
jgi:hypothetical protein